MIGSRAAPEAPTRRPLERCLDLLFPPLCVGCRRVGRWICPACWISAPWQPARTCAHCNGEIGRTDCRHEAGRQSPIDEIATVARFEGIAREAVHALKYEGRHAIAGLLAALMSDVVRSATIDLVTEVPLHRKRRRERGYDQAHMLARGVARSLDLPHAAGLLERTRYTTQQVSLDAEARARNMAGAFRARRAVEGRSILLVDDVFTTGATMSAAARALRDAGATRIVAVTFATSPIGGTDRDTLETVRPPASSPAHGPQRSDR